MWQWPEPHTGSSGMPSFGAKDRDTQSICESLPGAVAWRRRDSDFFSDANKIKDLAFRILVKIAQGHQKGHQKIPKELTIVNNVLIKFVYRKRGGPQFCQPSMVPFFCKAYDR